VGEEGGPERGWHQEQEHSPRERLPVADPAGRYRDIMARILTGLLAPQPPA
jgi:hypothetical protein